ncbi:MAG: hypothetical protein Q7S58_05855 [Candidatus Binatus sp.]|uniref:hypothetical protein n=1 Tax=Candidatus Binatus sp. TaxID=2811406 RepID=UPI0027166D36|nr:hypothetical protein [Candidatus Binatus sp.]MDO8431920.1 hypothetical protein [Candidatus Binatus sp.]
MTFMNRLGGFAAATVLACAIGFSTSALAQPGATTQRQLDMAAARASRKATVGANMNLTPAEATAFWPIYDTYEGKMDKIEDRHIAELKAFAKNYTNLSEADAAKKLDEVIDITQSRLDVQKEFVPKFRAVLPQVKVTRFFQIDNKIRALIQCSLAQIVPLAAAPGELAP